jgi:hypothetical protein
MPLWFFTTLFRLWRLSGPGQADFHGFFQDGQEQAPLAGTVGVSGLVF